MKNKESQNNNMPTVTIFVSSPQDVADARKEVCYILEHLQNTIFYNKLHIRPICWEDSAFQATESYQEQVFDPAEADIFITILWSRLGTRLDKDKFQTAEGKQYRSGTEYEIDRAFKAYYNSTEPDGKRIPRIIIFHNESEPRIPKKPRKTRDEKNAQLDALEDYIQELELHPEYKGIYAKAINRFQHTHELSKKLKNYFVDVFKDILNEDLKYTSWDGNPFRGLEYFDFEHAQIFSGRERIAEQVFIQLSNVIKNNKAFMLIGGSSGIGKSSFVRAGLLPRLLFPLSHWRFAQLRAADVVEGKNSLARVIAEALTTERNKCNTDDINGNVSAYVGLPSALPELLLGHTLEGFIQDVEQDLCMTLGQIKTALRRLTHKINANDFAFNEKNTPPVRLCLLLDQLEEFFTNKNLTHDEVESFFKYIKVLSESGYCVVLATIRADCLGYCERFPDLQYLKEGENYFHLSPINPESIREIICEPASVAGVSFEEKDSKILSDIIAEDAHAYDPQARYATILPVLEFTLNELYEKAIIRNPSNCELNFLDYENLGGLKGAITTRADETFKQFQKNYANANNIFNRVIEKMVELTVNGNYVRKKVHRSTWDNHNKDEQALEFIDTFITARLFIGSNEDGADAYVSIAHESLLTNWNLLSDWLKENRETLEIHSRFKQRFQEWSTKKQDESLLLTAGKPLEDAEFLLLKKPLELDDKQKEYVKLSKDRVESTQREREALLSATQKAKRGAEELILYMLNLANKDTLIEINREIDKYYDNYGFNDEESLYGKSEIILKQAEASLANGKALVARDKYKEASNVIQTVIEVKNIFSAKYLLFLYKTMMGQGESAYQLEEYERAISCYLESNRIAKKLYIESNDKFNAKINIAKSEKQLALAYAQNNMSQEALQYRDQALQSYQNLKHENLFLNAEPLQENYNIAKRECEQFQKDFNAILRLINIYVVAADDLDIEYMELEDLIEKLNTVTKYRLQYNLIRHSKELLKLSDCEICFILLNTKFGNFSKADFDYTYEFLRNNDTNLQKIYVLCKDNQEINPELQDFKDSFATNYGYFFCKFENIDTMKLQLLMQLEQYINPKDNVVRLGKDIQRNIEELTLKALTIMEDSSYTMNERIEQAQQAYSKAYKIASVVDFEKEKMLSLLFEYAQFLEKYTLYDLALDIYMEHNVLLKKIYGENYSAIVDSYNNISTIYSLQNNSEKSLEYSSMALEICEKSLDKEHPSIAMSYNNIGMVYQAQGDYDKALEYHLMALKIREKILGNENPDTTTSYNNIGMVYYLQGEYDKALKYLFISLERQEKMLGKEHLNTATSYNNIGMVYQVQGEYDKALKCLSVALEIQEKILGKEHPNTVTSYNNIGEIYNAQDDYSKAHEYLLIALEIQEKVLGREHPNTATSYNSIGFTYYLQGNYAKALEYYFMALEIREKIFGKDYPSTGSSYNSIGSVYHAQSDFAKALEYYFMALDVWKRVLGNEHPNTVESYNVICNVYCNIAMQHLKSNEYSEAEENFLKELEYREKVHDNSSTSFASTCFYLGYIYEDKNNYKVALDYYFKALLIFEAEYYSEGAKLHNIYSRIFFSYNSLAMQHFEIKEYGVAEKKFLKELEFRGKAHENSSTDFALTCFYLGMIYEEKNNFTVALDYYFKALLIFEDAYGIDNQMTYLTYRNIGIIYVELEQSDYAFEYLFKALDSARMCFIDNDEEDELQIATILGNIAWAYNKQGNYAKALECRLQVVQMREAIQGAEHLETASHYFKLAEIYENLNDIANANSYYTKALRVREAQLGLEHEDTRACSEKIKLQA